MPHSLREPLPRIDRHPELHERLAACARLAPGEVWEDSVTGHRVGVVDATSPAQVDALTQGERAYVAIQDPPYNFRVGSGVSEGLFAREIRDYLDFTRKWVDAILPVLAEDAHFYLWMGADQRRGFQPLADVVLLLREKRELESRSWITVRNQRGYGTGRNWMALRQEILYYRKGTPPFVVQHTAIPRILKGYYKTVGGRRTENSERSRSDTIRPGNVWMDVQQVFYRSRENVPGAYAQKPLAAIHRLLASTGADRRRNGAWNGENVIIDLFAHSGTTLVAAEQLGLRCFTADVDPVFAELTIRRLERYRATGEPGWQCAHPFPEIVSS
ncbi:MAG: DNA-methyltransferase [Spirochaetaceae bacterium]